MQSAVEAEGQACNRVRRSIARCIHAPRDAGQISAAAAMRSEELSSLAVRPNTPQAERRPSVTAVNAEAEEAATGEAASSRRFALLIAFALPGRETIGLAMMFAGGLGRCPLKLTSWDA